MTAKWEVKQKIDQTQRAITKAQKLMGELEKLSEEAYWNMAITSADTRYDILTVTKSSKKHFDTLLEKTNEAYATLEKDN